MKPLFLIALGALTLTFSCKNPKSKKSNDPKVVVVKPPKNGESVSHYNNGQICSIIPYKNGEREGKSTTYYRDGKINFVINFKQGKKEGKALWYYSMGPLYQTREYKDDEQHGWRNDFTPAGVLIMRIPYAEGHVLEGGEEFTPKGKPRPHPKIEVETQNSLYANGSFTYKFKLSEPVTQVSFYLDDLNGTNSKYWFGNRLSSSSSKKGEYKYHLMPGQIITEKIKVYAHFRRSNGYEGVISKTLNVALTY